VERHDLAPRDLPQRSDYLSMLCIHTWQWLESNLEPYRLTCHQSIVIQPK